MRERQGLHRKCRESPVRMVGRGQNSSSSHSAEKHINTVPEYRCEDLAVRTEAVVMISGLRFVLLGLGSHHWSERWRVDRNRRLVVRPLQLNISISTTVQ